MSTACPDTTYAEQIEADQERLRAVGCLTHDQYIDALKLAVAKRLKADEFLLAEHQLPIPWPARSPHKEEPHANPVHRRL